MRRNPSLTALALGLALALAGPAAAQGVRPAATISYLLGNVEVSRGGGNSWRAAKVNLGLFAGDRIRTGADGQAEIAFGGASRLRLAERTDMTIPNQPENQGGLLQRVSVTLGSVWANIRRLAQNESFEVEGGHSIGGVKGTRFQLLRRALGDRWRLHNGRLRVRRRGSVNDPVDLTDGQEVEVGPTRVGKVTPGDRGDMQRSFTGMNRRVAQQWKSALTKLLAAERRLVQQARRSSSKADLDAAVQKSREIGQAMRDALQQIKAFVEGRADPSADRTHGSGDLLPFADRALRQYERLHQQLQGTEPGSLRPAPQQRGSRGGAGGAGDAQKMRVIRAAEAFLNRYLQGLQRALRVMNRHLQGVPPKLNLGKLAQIQARLTDGFRQSEASYLRSREAARRDATGPVSPRVKQLAQKVEQRWRQVERNFRIARDVGKRVRQSLNKPPAPPPVLDPPDDPQCPQGECGGVTGPPR